MYAAGLMVKYSCFDTRFIAVFHTAVNALIVLTVMYMGKFREQNALIDYCL